MDTDSSYEDRSEVAGEDSSADDEIKTAIQHGLDDSLDVGRKSGHPKLDNPRKRKATESREERWERLQGHYSDPYLSIFNESSDQCAGRPKDDLNDSQIGLTHWLGSEKEQFFQALSKRSKADVQGIAASISSKSELQVYEYLRLLEEEDINTHSYAEEVNNVKYADIPAAAEISTECESLLEEAADALAVHQDKFDRAIGDKTHPNRWLIDHVQAEAYDKQVEDAHNGNFSDDSTISSSSIPAGGLFRLSSWLSLTERVFMNSDPSRNDNNWIIHAAKDEVPAITQEAISALYQLAIYELQKAMQTSIFCAESRIRATRDRGYTAKGLVKEQDVAAAISILGLQHNCSQFWLGLAQRNQLKVVDDQRKKGRGRRTLLNYDEVEGFLSEISGPRRGRRSVSILSESSSYLENSDHGERFDVSDVDDDMDVMASDQSTTQPSSNHTGQPGTLLPENTKWAQEHTRFTSGDTNPSCAPSDEEAFSTSEDDQDCHLGTLDQINSQREELRLCHELGWAVPEDIKVEYVQELKDTEEVLQLTQRKARPDLLDWRDAVPRYVESWEEHGPGLNEAQFVKNERHRKRRKIEQDEGIQQDLPFRGLRP